jgi:hypothetical protein
VRPVMGAHFTDDAEGHNLSGNYYVAGSTKV